jgi:hypothetical protein
VGTLFVSGLAEPFILVTSVDLWLNKGYQVTVCSLSVSLADVIDLPLLGVVSVCDRV